jgi:hypothetical protein
MSLRDEVEKLLPEWRHWYGNLFDAALDLGVIRATVCDPSTLLLSNRRRAVAPRTLERRGQPTRGVAIGRAPRRVHCAVKPGEAPRRTPEARR